jgi:hypothetical protein
MRRQGIAPKLKPIGRDGLAMSANSTRKGFTMKRLVLLASLLASTAVFANDIDPMGFEKEHFSSTMSRDDAMAKSQAPLVLGNKFDDVGRVVSPPSTKTRAQVAAETLQASRFGLMGYGERDLSLGTADQEAQIVAAGQRAIEHGSAAK